MGAIKIHRSSQASRRIYSKGAGKRNRRRGLADQTLAEYVSALSYKKIPQAVISHIKLCVVDSLGCALFGSTLRWGKIITSFAKEMGTGKGALIWGDGAEVPGTRAPLANGTLIHSFEMDDLHRVGVIHPGAEAIPAAALRRLLLDLL